MYVCFNIDLQMYTSSGTGQFWLRGYTNTNYRLATRRCCDGLITCQPLTCDPVILVCLDKLPAATYVLRYIIV